MFVLWVLLPLTNTLSFCTGYTAAEVLRYPPTEIQPAPYATDVPKVQQTAAISPITRSLPSQACYKTSPHLRKNLSLPAVILKLFKY